MNHRVLVPEGRNEYEWFRVLTNAIEVGDLALEGSMGGIPPFNAVIGVVPTHGAAVKETFNRLRRLRSGICVLVDGDQQGDDYVRSLTSLHTSPDIIIQWPEDWKIETIICWILEAGNDSMIEMLKSRIENHNFNEIEDLKSLFEVNEGAGRLKTDYLAYEEIASVIREQEACLARVDLLLQTITLACLGRYEESDNLELDEVTSSEVCKVVKFIS
jgi:5S rRNA maturation endonuclease (ribonuclease M5)